MVNEATRQQYIKWKASMEGDDMVKQRMQALLEVQQKGFAASQTSQTIARGARAELLEQTRALNTLTRSWQLAHPELSLLNKEFSILAGIGHQVLSIMSAINLMQLRQTENARNLTDAQQKLQDADKKYHDALATFGVLDDRTIKAAEDRTKAMKDLIDVQDRIDKTKWQDMATSISAVMSALSLPAQVLTAIAVLKALGTQSVGSYALWLSGAGLTALRILAGLGPTIFPLAQGIDELIENLSKVTSISDFWTKLTTDNPILRFVEQTQSDLINFTQFLSDLFVKWIPSFVDISVKTTIGLWGYMWKSIYDALLSWIDRIKQGLQSFWDYIHNGFKWLADKIIHHSVWPDMLDKLQAVTTEKLATIQNQFTQFSANVTKSLVGTGDGFSGAVDKASMSLAGAGDSLAANISKLDATIKAQIMLPILQRVMTQQPSVGADTSSIDKQIQDVAQKIQRRETTIFGKLGYGSAFAYAQDPEVAALGRQLTELQAKRDSLERSAQSILRDQQAAQFQAVQNTINAAGFTGISPAIMTMITAPIQQQIFAAQAAAQQARVDAYNKTFALPSPTEVNKDYVDSLRNRGYTGPVTDPNRNKIVSYQGLEGSITFDKPRTIRVHEGETLTGRNNGGTTIHIYVSGSLITEGELISKISKAIYQNYAGSMR